MRRLVATAVGLGVLAWLLADDAEAAAPASGCPGLPTSSGPVSIVRVDLPDTAGGYDHWRLRSDVAVAARRVVAAMRAVGARPSSSGGMRGLRAEVTATRSATSLHYIGRALDLWVGGAMADPIRDPYIVTRDGDRYWRVWARCRVGRGQRLTLSAVRAGAPPLTVDADVIDLTALMACHGLHRIRARRDAWDGIAADRSLLGGTEWWHFEAPPPIDTAFGDELLRIYSRPQVEGTPPWQFRSARWDGHVFAREVS